MNQRVIIYARSHAGRAGTEADLLRDLRQAVEDRGDVVVSAFIDDGRITGRGKYAGWNALVASLGGIDQVMLAAAADIPGRTVNDLFKILANFRDHSVGVHLHREGIDAGTGSAFTMLEIVEEYRAAKVSAAIRAGQARALAAGKRIGRPAIPPGVLTRIQVCLAAGVGIRPTARKFDVSPASVVNIRRAMAAAPDAEAA